MLKFKPFSDLRTYFAKHVYNKDGEHWKEGEPKGSTFASFVEVSLCPDNYFQEIHRGKVRVVLGSKFLKDHDVIGWDEMYFSPEAFQVLKELINKVKVVNDPPTPLEILIKEKRVKL